MRYFVGGTGTDVGKTYVTKLLCDQNGWRAMKPVASGNDDGQVLGCKPLYKFSMLLAPNRAARIEGVQMDFGKIVDYCKNSKADLIEGAGGIMSPLTDKESNLDLAKALELPILLVTGTHLGTISHTLTALEVLKGHDVKVILNQTEAADIRGIAADIEAFSGFQPIILLKNQKSLVI